MLSLLVGAGAVSARPNLLFLMADQMRGDAFGAAGNKHVKTPALDSIAKEGVRFTSGWSSTPTCTPARGALLTGKSPWNHGMLGYGAVATHYNYEMPKALAAAGYATAVFGKDHFGWNESTGEGYSHGYQQLQLYDGLGKWDAKAGAMTPHSDDYMQWFDKQMPGKDPQATLDDWNGWRGKAFIYNESLHPTAWVGRGAVNWLDAYSGSAPWFLKVSFHRPHSPYDPPQRVLDLIPQELPPPYVCANGTGQWDLPFRGKGCGAQSADAWCGEMPAADALNSRRCYLASIQFVDEWVGEVISAVRRRGWWDNTLVVFVSDHGDGQGDHYHWRKGYPYEFSAKVPFLLKWHAGLAGAKVAPGSVLGDTVELRDVLHTMIDAAEVTPPSGIFNDNDGKSLLNIVRGEAGWREWVDMEHSTCYNETNHWNALTDGRMKYVFNAFFPEEQLFNLTADPHEFTDLATSPAHQQELTKWRGRLVSQFEQEGRGSAWVQNGVLQRRTKGQTYSPNYPKN
eukprot:Hpha_TRINITY_DN15585_c1_g12::TRINITY_DN15585_c1_g12_i1::g.103910::m.103910